MRWGGVVGIGRPGGVYIPGAMAIRNEIIRGALVRIFS